MAQSHRLAMLGSVVRDAVAPVLRQAPPQCGIVTIVDVEISPDSSYATIYISALKDPEVALEYLIQERSGMQRKVADACSRFRAPRIRFRIDRAAEHGSHIEALLAASLQPKADAAPKKPRKKATKSKS
jgi:ribosome-binding factor A